MEFDSETFLIGFAVCSCNLYTFFERIQVFVCEADNFSEIKIRNQDEKNPQRRILGD